MMSPAEIAKNLVDVFKVGFRNLVKPDRITVLYPYEKIDYGERTRGWIGLEIRKCTSCMMCARICPSNAIRMYMAPNNKRYPGIDYGKCILCHFCISVCPTDALYLTTVNDLAWFRYRDLIYTPDKMIDPPKARPVLNKNPILVEYKYKDGKAFKVRKETENVYLYLR